MPLIEVKIPLLKLPMFFFPLPQPSVEDFSLSKPLSFISHRKSFHCYCREILSLGFFSDNKQKSLENYMDRISLLPNDFLLQILSLLPTKDVLNTSVLSKRWRYLWKLVPKLEYLDINANVEHGRFLLFVDRSLLLNTAPVLDYLHFKVDRQCSNVDIGFWVRIAAERGLRELDFDYCDNIEEPSRLPQSLFTCGTLVVLKLNNVSLVDVQFPVCFQLLKTLHLLSVIYLDDESHRNLLSSCPILEVLVVDRIFGDNVTTFSVMVPSLQRLIYDALLLGTLDSKLVMNTPSLKYLKIADTGYKCMIEYMPDIVEAHVLAMCSDTDDILRSFTSVKSLLLCFLSEPRFPTGSMFYQLLHLEFCSCGAEWDLLMSMLQHSPKLRSLKLNEIHDSSCGDILRKDWEEPSYVPQTLMSGLETFEWRNYRGWKRERELAAFILKHSCRLKTAMISPRATTLEKKHRMLTELALLPRGSTKCQLVFG